MNGLLNFGVDPATQGLLGAGSALLSAAGPSRTPVSFGQAVGQGLQAGQQAYGQGLLSQQQMQVRNMQIAQMQREAQAREEQARAQQQQQQYLSAFEASLPEPERVKFRVNPTEYIKELNKKYTVGNNLVTGDGRSVFAAPTQARTQVDSMGRLRYVDGPQAGQIVQGFNTPKAPEGFQYGADGRLEVIPEWLRAKKEIGQAGAPSVQTAVNVPPASKVFENENKLRDDYTTASKSFTGIRDAYNTVNAALSGPITAVSTLAGATKFMKMIDPESVVRESELNMALKSTGMLDRFLNLHNMVTKGQVLTPTQAKEIKSIAETLYKAAEKQQSATDQYYSGLATQYGLSPQRVIRNQGSVLRNTSPQPEDPNVVDFNNLPQGR